MYEYYPTMSRKDSNFNQPPPKPIETNINRERIGFNILNLFAISAIYRIFFILFAFVGIIGAATAKHADDLDQFSGYAALRLVYLILVIVAFITQLAIFIMDIINAFNVPPLSRIPINFVILGLDTFLFVGILVTSVLCFIKGRYIVNDVVESAQGPVNAIDFFRADSFYVCAIVGYLMSLLYLEELILLGFQMCAEGIANRRVQQTSGY